MEIDLSLLVNIFNLILNIIICIWAITEMSK